MNIKALYMKGMSISAIAKLTGVHQGTVKAEVADLGMRWVKLSGPPGQPEPLNAYICNYPPPDLALLAEIEHENVCRQLGIPPD